MKLSTLSLAIASVASIASLASAYTLNVDSYTSTPLFPSDTRALGSATNSVVTVDGVNPTVKLTTTETPAGYIPPAGASGNQEKAAPFFSTGGFPTPLGTLGDLSRGGLTADWKFESRGATTPTSVANIAAFRLLVDGPTPGTVAELVWEINYQNNPPTINPGTALDNLDIGSGNYWSRYLGQNYGQGDNGPQNELTLAQLAAGQQLTPSGPTFSDSTNVYGLQVSIGSDAGDYVGYVGDINATFTAVPEPTTLAALAGASAMGLRRRRRA